MFSGKAAACFIYLAMLMFAISCRTGDKYHLETHNIFSFEEASYKIYESPVRGGNNAIQVSLRLSRHRGINSEMKLLGIFFREKYRQLKYDPPNLYQTTFIFKSKDQVLEFPQTMNSKKVEISRETIPPTKKAFPFKLKRDESVLCYLHKRDTNYVKLRLEKITTNSIPR